MQLPKLQGKRLVSIYFGGGTPSLLGAQYLETLLQTVRSADIEIAPDCEITLEVNPEQVTLPLMQSFAAIGINRISLGVQSLDDSALNTLERQHSAQGAIAAIEKTAQAGIGNISIDLMYDLPGQTVASWERTLEQVEKLPIRHLSLYNLTFEPQTVFFKRKKELVPLLPHPEQSLEMLQMAVALLEKIGLKRYEISAFAKSGFASRHNSGYWLARPFLGFGPSAFSYWEKKRFRNVANLSKYHRALTENLSPVDFEEQLPFPEDVHELLAVQLRLLEGVDLSHFTLPAATHTTLRQLQEKGWLAQQEGRIALTEQGRLFYDSVAEALI